MNKARLGLLLAAATIAGLPAAAQAQDHGDHGRHGDQARPVGPGRGEGPRGGPNGGAGFAPQAPRPQQPAAAPAAAPAPQARPPAQADRRPPGQEMRGNWAGNRGGNWYRPEGQGRRDFAGQSPAVPAPRQAPPQQRLEANRGPVSGNDRRFDNRGPAPGNDRRFDNRPPVRVDDRRFDNRPGDNRGSWQRGWRNDRRYDWQGWRTQNRSVFRAPRYYPPRGFSYGYRLFSPGFRLDPFFYDQGYWLVDPWAYRLPPAYGPYRWVRYYNDVLLVDIRSGIVVDVIHDLFW